MVKRERSIDWCTDIIDVGPDSYGIGYVREIEESA